MTCLCRPVVLTVRAGDDQICVQVPPALVQKILLNTPPDKLHKTIGEVLPRFTPSPVFTFISEASCPFHAPQIFEPSGF